MKNLSKIRSFDEESSSGGMDNRTARRRLEEAIQLLPDREKAAYNEAREKCPLVVERDPDPMRFLHFDSFNLWEAAKRLTKYWTMRKELFGERAFLPMHQTGNGCLSAHDLEAYATGMMEMLPSVTERCEDGYICCYIPSRQAGNEERDQLMRCHWYFHNLMMEMNPVDNPSYTVLVGMNWTGFQRTVKNVREADILNEMPLFGKSLFLCQIPDNSSERMAFFQLIAPPILKLANRVQLGGRRSQVIAASSYEDLAKQLQAHGFQREHLPPELGGLWNMKNFRQWRKERIALELQREREYYKLPPPEGTSLPPTVIEEDDSNHLAEDPPVAIVKSAIVPSGSKHSRTKLTAEQIASLPPLGTIERKLAVDRFKSQRKRRRRKAKFEQLEADSAIAKAENFRLLEENSRLENLLALARQIVHSQNELQPNLRNVQNLPSVDHALLNLQMTRGMNSGSFLNPSGVQQHNHQQPPAATLTNNALLTSIDSNFSLDMPNTDLASLQPSSSLTGAAIPVQEERAVGGFPGSFSRAPAATSPPWWDFLSGASAETKEPAVSNAVHISSEWRFNEEEDRINAMASL